MAKQSDERAMRQQFNKPAGKIPSQAEGARRRRSREPHPDDQDIPDDTPSIDWGGWDKPGDY